LTNYGIRLLGSCLESGVKALHALVKVYDVGLHVLLIVRAVSCTPGSPLDLRLVRLGVRGKSVCTTFLLAPVFQRFGPLCSINSADASATALFADVAGTMNSSALLASS